MFYLASKGPQAIILEGIQKKKKQKSVKKYTELHKKIPKALKPQEVWNTSKMLNWEHKRAESLSEEKKSTVA